MDIELTSQIESEISLSANFDILFQICSNSNYTVVDSVGNILKSGEIISGGSETIIINNSSVVNSNSSFSESVLAESNLILPDTDVSVVNSLGNELANGSFPSVSTIEITVPDVNNVDSDGTVISTPSGVPFICTPSVDLKSAKLMKTGQVVSYRTGDDGNLQNGRDDSFLILPENNIFGNTNRFTDELGTQIYANTIIIDHSTYDGSQILACQLNKALTGNITWAAAIDFCNAFSVGGFSGWHLANITELYNFANYSFPNTSILGYSPFDASGVSLWCSTSNSSGVNAFILMNSGPSVGSKGAASGRAFPVRYFTLAELGF